MLTSPSELRHVTKAATDGPYLVVGAEAVSLSYPDHGNDACHAIEEASFWFQHRTNASRTSLQNDFKMACSLMWVGETDRQPSRLSLLALTAG